MGLESIQGGEFREHFANISGDPNRESWPIPEAVSIFAPRQTVIALPKRREREKKKRRARLFFNEKFPRKHKLHSDHNMGRAVGRGREREGVGQRNRKVDCSFPSAER